MGNQQISYSSQVIFNSQELFRIQGNQLKEMLHRSVGALTFLNIAKQTGHGSGALISLDVILTAAHNIYERKTKTQNTRFRFYLGQMERLKSMEISRTIQGLSIMRNNTVRLCHNKLKKTIEFDKYLPLTIPCEQYYLIQKEKFLSVFGFPIGQGNFVPLDKQARRQNFITWALIERTIKQVLANIFRQNFLPFELHYMYACYAIQFFYNGASVLRQSISDLGAQFIRILFRFKQSFWLTKQLISQDYYEASLKNVLQTNQINAKDIKTLTYDMARNPKTNQLNATAVFLVETSTEPNINPQILEHAGLAEQFKSLINNQLSSVQLFAAEGSKIELVKQ